MGKLIQNSRSRTIITMILALMCHLSAMSTEFTVTDERDSRGILTFTVLEGNRVELSRYEHDYNLYYDLVLPETINYEGIDYTVVSIGANAMGSSNMLRFITLPESLERIEDFAFAWASNLEVINIPDNVTYIGEGAFMNCAKLNTVSLPQNLLFLGERAFSDCESLYKITLPESLTEIKSQTFYNCNLLRLVDIPNTITRIEDMAFYGCFNLTKIFIPMSVEEMGYEVFGSWNFLYMIVENPDPRAIRMNNGFCVSSELMLALYVPEGSEMDYYTADPWCWHPSISISPYDVEARRMMGFDVCEVIDGEDVFFQIYDMSQHVKVVEGYKPYKGNIRIPPYVMIDGIEYGVDRIEYDCFSYSPDIMSVQFDNEFSKYSSDINFNHCINLRTTILPEHQTYIPGEAFAYCHKLQQLTLHSGINTIRYAAFRHCFSLERMFFPEGLETIESYAFENCYNLQEVDFPETLTKIGANCFERCDGLVDIVLPESLKTIESSVFSQSHGIRTVKFPSQLEEIKYSAFWNCSSLQEINLPETVTTIGSSAFYGCRAATSIKLPSGLTKIEQNTFGWCSSLRHIDLPEELTTIANSAFYSCDLLETIEIPQKVSKLEKQAFYHCDALKKVVLPESIEEIGDNAFNGCISLDTVQTYTKVPADITLGVNVFDRVDHEKCVLKVPYGSKQLYEVADQWKDFNIIDEYDAFPSEKFAVANDDGVTIYYRKSENHTAIVISGEIKYSGIINIPETVVAPDGITYTVKAIGARAFYECTELIKVNLPDSVTIIDEYAFYGCINLTVINIHIYITHIMRMAFYGCTSLTVINLPASVEVIECNPFAGCSSLTTLTVDANNAHFTSLNNIIYTKDMTEAVCAAGGIWIAQIPNTVTVIRDFAFYGCLHISYLCIPSKVTHIGEYAFANCIGIKELILGRKLIHIGAYAFDGCSSLISIHFCGATPPTLGENVFYNIHFGSVKVYVGYNLINIFKAATGWGSFTGWYEFDADTFDEDAHGNGIYDFSTTTDGQTIYYKIIDSDKVHVAKGATPYHGDLNIPETVTGPGNRVYTVSGIADNAFYRCIHLTSVNMPSTITYIGELSFAECENLNTIHIGANVSHIGEFAFRGCINLASINVASGNRYYKSIDGVLYNYDVTELIVVPCAIRVVNIPVTVTIIHRYAFYLCIHITEIVITSNVTVIGEYAFYGCSNLRVVTIGRSVTTISSYTFGYCTSLQYVRMCTDTPPAIVADTFYGVNLSDVCVYAPIGYSLSYKSVAVWKLFVTFVEFDAQHYDEDQIIDLSNFDITDAQPYNNLTDASEVNLTYTRTFNNTNWQALYVPFNMSYNEWSQYADVAKINDVHQFDDDGDGEYDRTVIEFKKVKSGELRPNTPYVIRAKAQGTYTFTCRDKQLLAAPKTEGSVHCTSTEWIYTLKGIYQPKTFNEGDQWYAMRNGAFMTANNPGMTLSPYRIYLEVEPYDGGYGLPNASRRAPSRISIMVDGEEETGIVDVTIDNGDNNKYYDLMGREVKDLTPGMYIHNGKKVIIR